MTEGTDAQPAKTTKSAATAKASAATLRQRLAEVERSNRALRKQLAEQTREAERLDGRLRALSENAPNYIHIVDRDLRVVFINRGGSEVSSDQIVGTKVGEFMEPADRQRIRRRLRRVLQTGRPTLYEFAGPLDSGGRGWYRTHAGPVRTGDNITGLALITYDITPDRLRTEYLRQRRREAEQAVAYDQALLNSIGEGLIVIDERGQVANANPMAAQMLNCEVGELQGRWFPEAVPALDELGNLIESLDRPVMRALLRGSTVSEQIYYRRNDGSTFPAAVTVAPVILDGRPIGAIEVFRDLSRDRDLDRKKEEFVSLASHQLRTPATGVKAYISILLDGYAGELTDRQQEFLQKVYNANERQLQIVGDMLNVAQADAGHFMPELVEVDFAQLLAEIVEEQTPTIAGRHQQLAVDLPQKPLTIMIDPRLIRMGVENLVSNASKYTEEGGKLSLRLKTTGRQVILRIQDSGVGIAESDIPKLFQRFSRIDNPLSRLRGGSGLGLYLTRAVILAHDGKIQVESQVGVGTSFTIELPLHRPAVNRNQTNLLTEGRHA